MGRIQSSSNADDWRAYMVESEVQHALVNWGRWSAVRAGRSARCSVLFVSLKAREEDTYSQSTPTVVDADAAWRAEKVICNPGFVPRWRLQLTAHYVMDDDKRATCRKLGMHIREYDQELWHASYGFWNRFKQG